MITRILYRIGWIQSPGIQHPAFTKADAWVTRLENQLVHFFSTAKSN